MSDSDTIYGTTLSLESIKVIAESIGIPAFPDDAAKELADDVSYRLKQIVQVGLHLMFILHLRYHTIMCPRRLVTFQVEIYRHPLINK